jgi:hypothetical protein
VEGAFEAYQLEEYSGVNKENVEVYAIEIADMLDAGDIDGTMGKMKRFFENIPCDIQIENEKYYQKYLGSGREIILVGAEFSTKKHNITDWKTEVLKF